MKYVLALLFLIITIQAVRACDCLLSPVAQHVKRTPYLLTGRVLEILDGQSAAGRDARQFRLLLNPKEDTAARGYTVKLRVEQRFKGKIKAGAIVTIASDFSNCAVFFEVGKQYVLFLHEEKGLLVTTHCSYSASLADALYPADLITQIQQATPKRNRH